MLPGSRRPRLGHYGGSFIYSRTSESLHLRDPNQVQFESSASYLHIIHVMLRCRHFASSNSTELSLPLPVMCRPKLRFGWVDIRTSMLFLSVTWIHWNVRTHVKRRGSKETFRISAILANTSRFRTDMYVHYSLRCT